MYSCKTSLFNNSMIKFIFNRVLYFGNCSYLLRIDEIVEIWVLYASTRVPCGSVTPTQPRDHVTVRGLLTVEQNYNKICVVGLFPLKVRPEGRNKKKMVLPLFKGFGR